jgi:hypothetical protein
MTVASRTQTDSCSDRDVSASALRAAERLGACVETKPPPLELAPRDDLEGEEKVRAPQIAEALQGRLLDQ